MNRSRERCMCETPQFCRYPFDPMRSMPFPSCDDDKQHLLGSRNERIALKAATIRRQKPETSHSTARGDGFEKYHNKLNFIQSNLFISMAVAHELLARWFPNADGKSGTIKSQPVSSTYLGERMKEYGGGGRWGMRSLPLDNPRNEKRRDGWNFLKGTKMFCERVPLVISLFTNSIVLNPFWVVSPSFEYLLSISSLKLVYCSCILKMLPVTQDRPFALF